MFDIVNDYIEGRITLEVDSLGNPSSRELKVATAFVLFELCRVDDSFARNELQTLLESFSQLFDCTDSETGEMMQVIEALGDKPELLSRFCETLRSNFGADQRRSLLSIVWRIILADGEVEVDETRYATRLRALLGLSMEQAILARQEAESYLASRSAGAHE